MPTKNPTGRPPIDKSGSGSTPVPVRFDNADLELIDAAVQASGFTARSAFIRHATLHSLTGPRQDAADAAFARRNDSRVLTAVEGELFAAMAELVGTRTPHAFGGGTITGPSRGIRTDDTTDEPPIGFDAGSLNQYLLFRAFGITLPRTTYDQARLGFTVDDPAPGDLVLFDEHRAAGGHYDYAAVYLGRGCIGEARGPGELLQINALRRTRITLRRIAT